MVVAPPSYPPHWPGGVPREIQVHADDDISEEEAVQEASGWFLFVEVVDLPLNLDGINLDY